MWGSQILLAVIGISAGIVVAGGLFSFIIEKLFRKTGGREK